MSATDLTTLASRVEAATAEMQGKMLDEAWEACAQHSAEFRRFACAYLTSFGTNAGKFAMAMDAHAYESAAMMLVPEGCGWELVKRMALGNYAATVKTEGLYSICPAATPALALTAACLRALAGRSDAA